MYTSMFRPQTLNSETLKPAIVRTYPQSPGSPEQSPRRAHGRLSAVALHAAALILGT